MKSFITIITVILIVQTSFAQEDKKPFFLGVQPSFTKEKFYDKNEFDINLIPFVFQKPISTRMDFRITTLANYHFGNTKRFSDIGVELATPIFLRKKGSRAEKSKGFFISPVIAPSRNNLYKHYTLVLSSELGYFFPVGEKFALSAQLQYGRSFFAYDNKANKWAQHFGIKVNVGFWL